MPLKPYEEFAPEPLAFPIGGKLYVVKPIGYREGLRLTEMINSQDGEFAESAEDIWKMVLGGTYDEMKTDNVPGDALARAAFAALTDFQYGRDMAEHVWESGLDPKALTERLTQRAREAAKASQASTRSRGTASASPTRSRASTRSTTSRKKS